MKTLKKSLCLILAVVMVVGVLAVSASAATYADDADIEYKEAVEVLTLIGVINGGDDGFAPKATLTREQAAKIVTYIVNQKSAESLAKTSSFSDVADGWWSAGYISYCSAQGIISGWDGKFAPNGTLTGTQWAKMLLCALGYNAEAEGYVGDNWEVNVVSKAEEIGLTKGIEGFNYSANVTREEACQMAFNALNVGKAEEGAFVVEYSTNGQNINVSGSDINVSITTGAVRSVTNQTLASKYFSKLSAGSSEDAFGRPAVEYTYSGDTVSVAAKPVATYTSDVSANTLRTALGLKTTANEEAVVIVDGQKTNDVATISKSTTTKFKVSNGQTAELYNIDDSYVIYVTNTYVGKVTAVKAANEKTDTKRTVTVEGMTYETEDFEKNDIVLYTKANDEIQSMALAEEIEAVEVSKVTGSNAGTSFVADGDTYKLSATIAAADIEKLDIEATVNLYLDEQGYVIKIDTYTAASSNNVIVLDVEKSDSTALFSDDSSYYAQVVTTEGKVEVIEIDKDTFEAFDGESIKIASVYDTDKENVYELRDITSTEKTTTVSITKGKVQNTLANGNSSTVYIVETVNGEKSTYNVYTGYKNVPSISATSGVEYTKTGSKYASIIFVTNAEVDDDTTSNVLIALDSKSPLNRDSSNKDGYYTYNAVVDGEATTINVNADVAPEGKGYVLASKITVNTKGFVTGITNAVYSAYEEYTGVKFAGDVLEVGADILTVSADVRVFTITDKGAITAIDVEDITEDENDTAVVVTNNKDEVTELYIFEVED